MMELHGVYYLVVKFQWGVFNMIKTLAYIFIVSYFVFFILADFIWPGNNTCYLLFIATLGFPCLAVVIATGDK